MSISINISIDPNIYLYMLFALDKYASHWKYTSKSKVQHCGQERLSQQRPYTFVLKTVNF